MMQPVKVVYKWNKRHRVKAMAIVAVVIYDVAICTSSYVANMHVHKSCQQKWLK